MSIASQNTSSETNAETRPENRRIKDVAMQCVNCQNDLPQNASFCPQCATPIQKMPPAKQAPARPMQTIGGMQTIDPTPINPIAPIREPAEAIESGSVFADRYLIHEQLGAGGMGVVYRATDQLSEKVVALKLIRSDRVRAEQELKRLKQEGLTARDIRHKNVVAVYDIGEYANQPFISMEYMPGRSLRQWHRSWHEAGREVPLSLARKIVAQILDGLKAAHEEGVIHRDLKPENVMVVNESPEQFAVKILDFGISRANGSAMTTTGAMGTVGYMAPEQKTSPDLAGPAADLYSVSVMLYELLMDVLPQGHWQPPSGGRTDVPKAIDQLIEKGLSNRPANRIQNADDYLQKLNNEYQLVAVNDLTLGATNIAEWFSRRWKKNWNTMIAFFNPGSVGEQVTKKRISQWCWVGLLFLLILFSEELFGFFQEMTYEAETYEADIFY